MHAVIETATSNSKRTNISIPTCNIIPPASLYTMSKDSGHETLKALETFPKAVPWIFKIAFCVVMSIQV
jgi:hypothetical protein